MLSSPFTLSNGPVMSLCPRSCFSSRYTTTSKSLFFFQAQHNRNLQIPTFTFTFSLLASKFVANAIMSGRKKSLLIGINYTGSQNQLNGCHQDVENVAEFLSYRGYSDDPRSQIIMRDDMSDPYYPSGHNMLVCPADSLLAKESADHSHRPQ